MIRNTHHIIKEPESKLNIEKSISLYILSLCDKNNYDQPIRLQNRT